MGSPDFSDSCMIALYPSNLVAQSLAVDGGLAPDDLHLTIAYIGPADDINPDQLNAIASALADRPPITARISGHARFTGGKQDVAVALADSPDLETLRRDVTDALSNAGIVIPRDHGYIPHLTTSYLTPDDPAPYERLPASTVTFTALSVVHGAQRTDHSLGRDVGLAAAAREAYAAGWASSGGPMTERVRAGCAVAMEAARERPHDPHVLEVTVDLGRLEGMWALLFHRRDKQQDQHTAAVVAAWAALFDEDTVRSLIAELPTDAEAGDSRQAKELAAATASAMLRTLSDFDRWEALRQTVVAAMKAGRAEGIVSAVAIAAEQARRVGLDWDVALADAEQMVKRLGDTWTDSGLWLSQLITRAAINVVRAIAGLGADVDEMVRVARALLGDATASGVALTVDWAMTDAATQGALALYQTHGATELSIITVGDTRVCAHCEHAEAKSPYPADAPPALPMHPLCRCTYSAEIDLAPFDSWFL